MCVFARFVTFDANLSDSGFLSSNEDLETRQICSDVQIHHILKLWFLYSCSEEEEEQRKKKKKKRRVWRTRLIIKGRAEEDSVIKMKNIKL